MKGSVSKLIPDEVHTEELHLTCPQTGSVIRFYDQKVTPKIAAEMLKHNHKDNRKLRKKNGSQLC